MADTIIGSNITIEGDITGNDSLVIEGIVRGTVAVKSDVTVTQDGHVEADVGARVLAGEEEAVIATRQYRGHAIDETALALLLKNGSIAGAGLDVYENEPVINPKLLELDNVVLLPHMSSATVEGRLDMGEKVLINIQTWADGHTPPDRVIGTGG